jgi:hypothetical protein
MNALEGKPDFIWAIPPQSIGWIYRSADNYEIMVFRLSCLGVIDE